MLHDWAGLSFLVLGRRDAMMIRGPGVYALVRRDALGGRTLLYVDHAAAIAQAAAPGGPGWDAALAAGVNEIHVFFLPGSRLDGLQLAARVRRACETAAPPLRRAAG